MRVSQRSLLGVDLTPRQIRIVEIQGRASAARVIRAAIGSMPEGAFAGDRIMDVEAVGLALKRLVESMGAVSREAVFGLASGSVNTQVMGVPHVPDDEVMMVLQGELEHFKIVREGEGVFDFTRLKGAANPANGADAGEAQMLLMASEKTVVSAYHAAAEYAGLRLLALEPTLLAMYRVGWLLARDQPSAICLSISQQKSEVAVIEDGGIRLYRRVDVGSDSLFPTPFAEGGPVTTTGAVRPPKASILTDDLEGEEYASPLTFSLQEDGAIASSQMNMSAARMLALEVRRSLEYYRRENPQSTTVSEALLVTDTPAVQPFLPWLTQELGIEVRLARPADIKVLDALPTPHVPDTGTDTQSELGDLILLPTLGLALGMLPDQPAAIPHFDLSTEQTANANAEAAKRTFTLALAASIVMLLIGAGFTFAIGSRANDIGHIATHLQDDYTDMQKQYQMDINRFQAQQQELAFLRKKGFPFPRLMDAVTEVIPASVGLTEVDLESSGKMTLIGNADSDGAVVKTRDGLGTVSWFLSPSVDTLDRKPATQTNQPYVQFKIVTQVAGAGPSVSTTTGSAAGGGNR